METPAHPLTDEAIARFLAGGPIREAAGVAGHLAACPECAARARVLAAWQEAIAAAGPPPETLPAAARAMRAALQFERPARPLRAPLLAAAAALLLAAAGAGWRLHADAERGATEELAALLVPSGPVRLGLSGEAVVWHSCRGLTVTLARRAAADADAETGEVILRAGECWCEAAPGAPAKVRTPLGTLHLDGAAWVALGSVPQAVGFVAEAEASLSGTGDAVRVAVASGAAAWEGREVKAGRLLEVEAGEVRERDWGASERARAEAWARLTRARGWRDLLADADRLGNSGVLSRLGQGGLALRDSGGLSWVRPRQSAFAGQAGYVLEIEARVLGTSCQAAVVYPADGRLPTVDLPGGGRWTAVRIVSGPGGTEVLLDGECVLRLAPGALEGAQLREHDLPGHGLLLWHEGVLEVRSWRVKALGADGAEVGG